MNCNTTHYRANSSSVPGDPTFGNPNNFEIPGGRYLEVLPMQFKEDRVRLRVLLIEGTSPPPLDTDFTVPNHGNIWVGGPRNPDGVLLISIGAEATR